MKRSLVIAASLVLIGVVSFRWWLPGEHSTRATISLPDTRFDYSLTDYQARFHDALGQPELNVAGPRLEHDAETRVVSLTEPEFSVTAADGDWQGQARRGRFTRDEALLELEDTVIITRDQPAGRLTIATEALQHLRPARTISADVPVTVTRPGTELTAGGLMIHLDNETVELSNDVYVQTRPADRRSRSDRVRSGQ